MFKYQPVEVQNLGVTNIIGPRIMAKARSVVRRMCQQTELRHETFMTCLHCIFKTAFRESLDNSCTDTSDRIPLLAEVVSVTFSTPLSLSHSSSDTWNKVLIFYIVNMKDREQTK